MSTLAQNTINPIHTSSDILPKPNPHNPIPALAQNNTKFQTTLNGIEPSVCCQPSWYVCGPHKGSELFVVLLTLPEEATGRWGNFGDGLLSLASSTCHLHCLCLSGTCASDFLPSPLVCWFVSDIRLPETDGLQCLCYDPFKLDQTVICVRIPYPQKAQFCIQILIKDDFFFSFSALQSKSFLENWNGEENLFTTCIFKNLLPKNIDESF